MIFLTEGIDLHYCPSEGAYRIERNGLISQPFKTQFDAKRSFERKRVRWTEQAMCRECGKAVAAVRCLWSDHSARVSA